MLVDHDVAAQRAILANLESVGFGEVARFQRTTAASFLAGGAAEAPFDVVFLDPPYDTPTSEVDDVLVELAVPPWLSSGATVVIERPKAGEAITLPEGWRLEKERTYGDTRLVVANA